MRANFKCARESEGVRDHALNQGYNDPQDHHYDVEQDPTDP